MQVLARLNWSTRGKVLEMVAAARMATQAWRKVRCKVWRSSGSPPDIAKSEVQTAEREIFEVSGLGSAANLGAISNSNSPPLPASSLPSVRDSCDSRGGPSSPASHRFPTRVSTQRVTGTLALAAQRGPHMMTTWKDHQGGLETRPVIQRVVAKHV